MKKKTKPSVIVASLRPYPGILCLTRSRATYLRQYKRMFGFNDRIDRDSGGRCSFGTTRDGELGFVVWADNKTTLAHELSHVVLDLFDHCGIDPNGCNGEPFCYMMQQLTNDVLSQWEDWA